MFVTGLPAGCGVSVVKLKSIESGAVEGDSPVGVSRTLCECIPK